MGAELFAWLVGLFLLVGGVCWYLLQFLRQDSHSYDEQYVWQQSVEK